MGMYSLSNELAGTRQTLATAYKSLCIVTATSGSLAPGEVLEMDVGVISPYAATDTEVVWDISRQTIVGTATAATPTVTNPKFVACAATGAVNATAEGTITAASSVLNFAGNQRASYSKSFLKGSGLWFPPTAAAGFALRAKSVGGASLTGGATGELKFDE